MKIKKLFFFSICFCLSHAIIAQHFGGIFASTDWSSIPKNIPINEKPGNYFKDSHFSIGYTIGYQGLIMSQRRFSITYGLYYSYVTALSGTSLFHPYIYEGKWNTFEMPIGARYNILKGSKFQPYISFNIIMIYPITSAARLVNNPDHAMNNLWFKTNDEIRLYGNVELAIGLNYRTNNYIFNLHPFLRPRTINLELPRKFGLAFAVLKKF